MDTEPDDEETRPGAPASLSALERHIIGLVGAGMSGTAAANTLGLTHDDIAGHLVQIRRKLGVDTTRAAVAKARGSAEPPPS